MIWAVAGIFSTSFRLLSTTRTLQACEVFIIARAVLQDFEAFLVYFDESLQSVTPSHSSWVGWLWRCLTHSEHIARAWACPERQHSVVLKNSLHARGSVMLLKMPPKGTVNAKSQATVGAAVSSAPPKRQRRVVGGKTKTPKLGACSALSDSQSESSSSDDYSDPDDDVMDSDFITADGQHALDFDCVRDASRGRVAERTRTQYDQFVGLMAVFALSTQDFKSLVIQKQNLPTFQLPLPIRFVSEYLTHVESKRVQWPGKDGKVKPVSPAYYKAVVLSIKDLYMCEQSIMADDLSLLLFSKRKKFQREIQEMRAVGTYPSAQQRFITSEGYHEVAKAVVQSHPRNFGGWAVQAFAALWGYVVLLWCLMARCDRVARVRWADFGWYQDAMTAYICKSKCDQAGVNAFHKKLYYNDACAEVCPVTALSVIFFSREDESIRSDFVFPRSDTRRAGARYLSKIIGSKFTAADSSRFGCDPLGISWHHFKRGAFTFLAGLTDACSYVATKMRADQKVVDVSRVYTFFGQGQDGVVGRLLSMLPYGEPAFIGCAPVLSSGHPSISWGDVVPDWDTLDANFKFMVVPRLFAVLVHRLDWLKQNLPDDHPLWHSEISTSGQLLRFTQFVQLEVRPLSNLTGVSLEMKNAIRIHTMCSQQHSALGASAAAPPSSTSNELRPLQLPPSERDDLGLRLLTPLPTNKQIIPHLSCQQAWRAFFITTDSLPYPLRYAEGKLTLGSDVTALSRIKTVMNAVSKGIAPKDILQYPEATFQCGFANLQRSLFAVDADMRIFPYNTCGTIEAKLRGAKRIGWTASEAVFCVGVVPARPNVYDAAEAREAQVRLAEAKQRQTTSVCGGCRGACLHCTHCDECNTRMNVIQSTAAAREAAQQRMAEAEMIVLQAKEAAKRKGGVRCLRCAHVFFDKSGYNRHLLSHHTCAMHPAFEHKL